MGIAAGTAGNRALVVDGEARAIDTCTTGARKAVKVRPYGASTALTSADRAAIGIVECRAGAVEINANSTVATIASQSICAECGIRAVSTGTGYPARASGDRATIGIARRTSHDGAITAAAAATTTAGERFTGVTRPLSATRPTGAAVATRQHTRIANAGRAGTIAITPAGAAAAAAAAIGAVATGNPIAPRRCAACRIGGCVAAPPAPPAPPPAEPPPPPAPPSAPPSPPALPAIPLDPVPAAPPTPPPKKTPPADPPRPPEIWA